MNKRQALKHEAAEKDAGFKAYSTFPASCLCA